MAGPSGFFLGGAAEGMLNAQKQALAEQTQQQDVGLRTRAIDLQEQQFRQQQEREFLTRADKQIDDTMAVVAETIKAATAVGRSPDQIIRGVQPLVAGAQAVAARVGRDPDAIAARVQAMATNPSLIETARATGEASAAQRIAEAHAIAGATGTNVDISPYKDQKDRVTLENTLRDDFVKASKDFTTVRDFYDRMKAAGPTGAGDLSLVFSYMKMLDPGSTVREGEYATAQNAAGVPEGLRGLINNVVGGGKLSAEARQQIKDQAGKIWSQALNRHSAQVTQYRDIAKRQGLRPSNVIVDLTAGSEGPVSGTTSSGIKWNFTPGEIPRPPAGFEIVR